MTAKYMSYFSIGANLKVQKKASDFPNPILHGGG